MKRVLSILLLLGSICAFSSCSSDEVVLAPNTRYYGNYSVDGHLLSNSTGKSFEYFPSRSVFTNIYLIKNGNEVWSEYGKVAKISMSRDGTISIYSCKNDNIRVAIGHIWIPE